MGQTLFLSPWLFFVWFMSWNSHSEPLEDVMEMIRDSVWEAPVLSFIPSPLEQHSALGGEKENGH